MKFSKYTGKYIPIVAFLLLFVLVQLASSTKSRTKSKSKKETMMEFLNTFFSEGGKKKGESYYADSGSFRFAESRKSLGRSHIRAKSHYRGDLMNRANNTDEGAAGNATDAAGGVASGEAPVLGEVSPVLQEWFEISSKIFKNKDRYPPVLLPDGTSRRIETDPAYFRINFAYRKAASAEEKPPGEKYFYFRLSGLNLYYSSTKTDMNVLDAMEITSISHVFEMEGEPSLGQMSYCLKIEDDERHKWKLCSPKKETITTWSCHIKKLLGQEDPSCAEILGEDGENAGFNGTIVEKNITQPILIIPIPSHHCNEDWDYQTNGETWECDCKEGREQAPIDLPPESEAIDSPVKPLFQYEEIAHIVKTAEGKKKLKIKLEDNMLKIIHDKFGKLVTMDGRVYHANEIQFHTPGEHTIAGKKFDMEVQIIHYGVSKGDLAKQAILAFPVEKVPGIYNKFIDDIDFFNLPNAHSPKKELSKSIFIPRILYNAEEEDGGFMKPFSFYTYQGSLTSPPCSEDTIIYVASKPVSLGSTAIRLFQEALREPDEIGPMGEVQPSGKQPISNRKIQETNGRPVFFFDHGKYCGPDPAPAPETKVGHYEKIQRPVTDYFYVQGEKTSGLPGAFVVSKQEAEGTAAES